MIKKEVQAPLFFINFGTKTILIMKKILSVLSFLSLCLGSFAQYPIGHRTITYQDPARSNRDIETEIYYPAITAGDNTDVASGQFPIIVFGHGFVMSVSSYENIWTALAPLGYIVALPTTEGGAPSHSNFGLDLAFLINKIKSEGANLSSPFYQKVAATSAVMGHSMGGGSSFLACENNTAPTVMITLAAAVTDPSSVTAATHVTIPTLVISGAEDCVAPPNEHQVPMFDSLASECKVYISINGGGHCNFANYNFACTFGEETCNPGGATLEQTEQQATTMNFVKPYLDYFLNGTIASWNSFVDSLNSSTKITFIKNCNINPETIDQYETPDIRMDLFPNPVSEMLTISVSEFQDASIVITDIEGKMMTSAELKANSQNMDITFLSQGVYLVRLYKHNELLDTQKFIKM